MTLPGRIRRSALALLLLSGAAAAQDDLMITDLEVTGSTATSVSLQWTTHPDANVDEGALLDLRYSTDGPIDADTWDAATEVDGEPDPEAGAVQTMDVTGLTGGLTYHFAIAWSNEASGVISPPSNSVMVTLGSSDTTDPGVVGNFALGTVTSSSVQLTWTATGDDGDTGQAAQYDVRYSTQPINAGNFLQANYAIMTAPKPNPQAETLTITGLSPSTTYYFAVMTGDEVPNWGAMSTVLNVQTLVQPPDDDNERSCAAGGGLGAPWLLLPLLLGLRRAQNP